ncbi:MAG: hypothetical protein HUJ78_02180 [Mogibacterium sp.]|nr:hypothetical protein [Mogibacterium sp.]
MTIKNRRMMRIIATLLMAVLLLAIGTVCAFGEDGEFSYVEGDVAYTLEVIEEEDGGTEVRAYDLEEGETVPIEVIEDSAVPLANMNLDGKRQPNHILLAIIAFICIVLAIALVRDINQTKRRIAELEDILNEEGLKYCRNRFYLQ